MKHGCRNCGVFVAWGFACGDCVRAFAVGAAGALGAWALERWLR